MNTNAKKIAWIVWITASVFYAYQYILRVMPSILLDDIMTKFNISTAAFGQFSGIYYIGYSLIHIPVGIASHWAFPVAGRLLVGIGSSAAILGLFKIIRMTFSAEKFPRMLSLSVTIGIIGAIYGGGPVSYMHQHLGYAAVLKIFAAIGIALAALTYWIVPESKPEKQESVFANIKEVLTNQKVILTCLFAGMMVGPLEGFADVWGSIFFKQVYGFEGTLAASFPSMIFIGMCFGAPALSLIADKVGSYLATIVGAGITMSICFTLLLTKQQPISFLSISFMLIGVCCAYQILAIYKASTYVRSEVAGITTALANMIIMLFGYAFHTAIGTTISTFGGSTSPLALQYGIAVIPVGLALGTLGFIGLFLLERKAKPILN
jgi:predicted MFS family arabinose efflux permease